MAGGGAEGRRWGTRRCKDPPGSWLRPPHPGWSEVAQRGLVEQRQKMSQKGSSGGCEPGGRGSTPRVIFLGRRGAFPGQAMSWGTSKYQGHPLKRWPGCALCPPVQRGQGLLVTHTPRGPPGSGSAPSTLQGGRGVGASQEGPVPPPAPEISPPALVALSITSRLGPCPAPPRTVPPWGWASPSHHAGHPPPSRSSINTSLSSPPHPLDVGQPRGSSPSVGETPQHPPTGGGPRSTHWPQCWHPPPQCVPRDPRTGPRPHPALAGAQHQSGTGGQPGGPGGGSRRGVAQY